MPKKLPHYLLHLLAGAVLLPFLVLLVYSHPYFDDFSTGWEIKRVGFTTYFTHAYIHWTGRYAFLLANSLHPFRFGWLNAYHVAVVSLIAGLVLSCYVCMAGVTAGSSLSRSSMLACGSGLLVAVLTLFPSPAEGFYWVIGGYNYTLPISVGLLILGIGLYLQHSSAHYYRQRLLQITLLLLAFAFPGFSEFSACLTLLVVLVLMAVLRPSGRFWQLTAGLALLGVLLMFASPGNLVRYQQQNSSRVIPIMQTLLLSGSATAYTLLNWVLHPVIGAVGLLLASTLNRLVSSGTTAATRLTRHVYIWPGLLVAGMFTCYLFSYLAVGQPVPLRARNLLYVYTLICAILSLLGIFQQLHRQGRPIPHFSPLWMTGLLGLTLLYDANPKLRNPTAYQQLNTPAMAYRDWLSGDARRYNTEQKHRYYLIRNTKADSVLIPPLTHPPTSLLYYDVSENPALWSNKSLAIYFGKQAVWVRKQ